MKILVTGATGFLGSNLVPVLEKENHEVVGLSSRDGDLTKIEIFRDLIRKHEPELVIHLAGLVGGIEANRSHPASFFYINQAMTANLFEAVKDTESNVFVTIGGCSYPGNAHSPISEEQMWDGYPQVDSAPFSVAKKTAITAATAYRYQYGIDTKVIIPGNMFGPFDNFRKEESHVVPALIRKFHEAKVMNLTSIPIWGTGKATRDFIFVGDVAQMIASLVVRSDVPDLMNLSAGSETSIRELAELLKSTIAPQIELQFDTSAPEGQLRKVFSTRIMDEMGLKAETSLEDGLKTTYEWLLGEFENRSVSLRW